MLNLPTPHGDKLKALVQNRKLPMEDQQRVTQAIERYEDWLQQLRMVDRASEGVVSSLIALLNSYKNYVELELIFDSDNDFLYRQKGQLKLDNTVIEEFLPIFVTIVLADQLQKYELLFGPITCFSSIRFESSIKKYIPGGGIQLREKDHDFVVGRKVFIRTSHLSDFRENTTIETHIAYVAAECKTNLDKTMFQEAAATVLDVKTAVPGAKYYLLCEWLDMTPISTSTTAIDEIIILRKARRLPADIRGHFNTSQGRRQHRTTFIQHLEANPLSVETFSRFLSHILGLMKDDTEGNILTRGYF